MKIAELITIDGEVITAEDLKEKKLQFELLTQLDFDAIREYFIKKTIILLAKQKETKSGGANGITPIDILEDFKWKDLQVYLDDLVKKGSLVKKQSINTEVYFTKQKTKK